MARPLRIDYPGAFYHAYTRGLERREIFRDKRDFETFLAVLAKVQKATAFICHSYCLMPNHYHAYLETPHANLSKIMQEINGKYTQYYNRRYKRVGPLFQGRFKSKLVDKDGYSQQLCRYIHLNPVKAKLCSRPSGYAWSSYAAFMGRAKKPDYLETGWLLKQIGGCLKFEEFTMRGLKDHWDPLDIRAADVVMGSEEFIGKMKEVVLTRPKDSSLTGLRTLQKDARVKAVESFVSKQTCDENDRKKLLMYGLRCYTGLSLKEVGVRAGNVSPIAVCQAVRRLKNGAREDRATSKLVKELDRKCKM